MRKSDIFVLLVILVFLLPETSMGRGEDPNLARIGLEGPSYRRTIDGLKDEGSNSESFEAELNRELANLVDLSGGEDRHPISDIIHAGARGLRPSDETASKKSGNRGKRNSNQ